METWETLGTGRRGRPPAGDARAPGLRRLARPSGGAGGRRAPRLFAAAGTGLLAAMVAAQVASGLRPGDLRLTTLVVVLLAAAALAYAAAAHTLPRAAGAFAAAVAAGYAAEWIGTRTGLPFGRYRYTGVLWPSPGGVPLIVALAWGGMGLAAHAVARRVVPGGRAARLAAGALALTAWDLFLDPQMLRLGLWEWAQPGPYRGVPVSNFIGWFLVSLLVMALIGRIAGGPEAGSTGLVAVYTVMALMETVGFAAVFRPPDPLVATAGGIAMGAFALLAWRRRWRK
ncbi:carotenoid biosynthesis protein [Microbispora sp. NPDC049125]|uniref:carotenoid biosynthesis protein n=1 Tax=Microbispora sp. NPDC049125 TaxID=3154929 RepID=UPI003467E5AF